MNPVAGLKIERALICSIDSSPNFRSLQDFGSFSAACRLPGSAAQYRQFYRTARPRPRTAAVKTSMNLLLWATHVTSQHFPLLAKLKQAGWDGVEMPLFEGDATHYRTIRAELDNLGLRCSSAVTVATPDANPISPEGSIRQAGLDRIRWALDMTAALGGDVLCGPYHSPLGVFSGQPPTETEKEYSAEVLRQAAEHGQDV